jgi:hypothetical protein
VLLVIELARGRPGSPRSARITSSPTLTSPNPATVSSSSTPCCVPSACRITKVRSSVLIETTRAFVQVGVPLVCAAAAARQAARTQPASTALVGFFASSR